MTKDTSKILEELNLCEDFHTFYLENQDAMITQSLSEMLGELLHKKNLKKTQVIRNSEMNDIYVYQIFSGIRRPERKKLLALALAMGLSVTETQTLLKCATYPPLYAKIPFDCIVLYGITKGLSVIQVNNLLYDYGEETLGEK